MMIIAICDDNKAVCTQLEDILLEYAEQVCLKINVEVFYSGEDLINYINQGNSFDLIYLDIEMDRMNGIAVGHHLRKDLKDYKTEFVYISGKDSYDRQLFDVQPLHFIAKPIKASIVIDDLKLAMERAQKKFGYFQYQKGYDSFKVPTNEIIYFESLNREIKIVMIGGEDYFYGTLDKVMIILSGYQFLKIHRSYLINYCHISVLRYSEIVMSNGVTLPISRSKRQELRSLHISEI